MLRNRAETSRYMATLISVISMTLLPTSYSDASSETPTDANIETTAESHDVTTTKTNIETDTTTSSDVGTDTANDTDTETDTETDTDTDTETETDTEAETETEADTETETEADYTDIISEEYFYSDLPIVFTATRLEQSISETPVSMTIIDKEMIKASGALEIAELMRLVPGMQVANYGGDEYFVTYHGRADLYSRSLQVLVDGRSIYNPVIGGVSWSGLPLAMEDIKRIEVIRGSNAAAFGSNSFSGVINIITEDPAQQQGTLVKTTIGDKHTRQVLARNAGKIGDLNYRLTLNYDEKDGLKSGYDDASNKWMSFRGDYKYDSNNKIMLQAGYSGGTQQTSSLGVPRDTDSTSSFQQVKWTHTIDNDSEYSLHFFHNHKELDDTFTTTIWPFNVISGFSYESDRYELEFQHLFKPASDLRLAWGAGLRHDNTVSPDTLNQDSAAIRNQVHAFVNAEWKPRDDTTVNLGAMLEKYEGFSGMLSPRVALNYALKENHIFRISHSTAYRMPNVWEEQIDLRVNDTSGALFIDQLHRTVGVPDPEKVNSIELGYMAAFKDIPITMDIKLFKEKISPVINYAWDSSTNFGDLVNNGAGNFNNDGRVEINGLEIQLDFQPTDNTNIHAVYSRLDASGSQVSSYDASGQPSEYHDVSEIVPKETFGILASHRFDNGIQLSSGFYHTGRTTWLDPGDETDAYNKWDLRVGKTFKLPDATIDVSAILHNVTDNDYQEYFNENQAQRELYLQVGIKF